MHVSTRIEQMDFPEEKTIFGNAKHQAFSVINVWFKVNFDSKEIWLIEKYFSISILTVRTLNIIEDLGRGMAETMDSHQNLLSLKKGEWHLYAKIYDALKPDSRNRAERCVKDLQESFVEIKSRMNDTLESIGMPPMNIQRIFEI